MNVTKIDWLGFRSQAQAPECLEALRGIFGDLGPSLRATPMKKPRNGFEQGAVVSIDDMAIGAISYGGECMRGWVTVDITGKGCEWVSEWDKCEGHLSGLDSFQTKRVDIALDTFKREVTHESVVQAHRAGQFTTCGRPPSMKRIEPEDPTEGRTAYVGKRDQPKFLRAYEKGYEIASRHRALNIISIDGVPVGDMYRLELELKRKNVPLPDDLIENRDQYFAGAYPYLQSVLDVKPESFRLSRERGPRRSLASMLALLKTQYGNTLFTALAAYGGDVGAVFDKIVGKEHNEKLLAEGVLLVDHD